MSEPVSVEQVLSEFGEYCHSIRMDWSDFDGRHLFRYWKEVEESLRTAIRREKAEAVDEAIKQHDARHVPESRAAEALKGKP